MRIRCNALVPAPRGTTWPPPWLAELSQTAPPTPAPSIPETPAKAVEKVPDAENVAALERIQAKVCRICRVEFGDKPPGCLARVLQDFLTVAENYHREGTLPANVAGLDSCIGDAVRNCREMQRLGENVE